MPFTDPAPDHTIPPHRLLVEEGTGSGVIYPLTATPGGAAGGVLKGTYPDPELADEAVTTEAIADGAVTDDKISDVSTEKLTGEITDEQHGERGGGALHELATTESAGFMSATDKEKLDGVVAAPQPWHFHGGNATVDAGGTLYLTPGRTGVLVSRAPAICDAPFPMKVSGLKIRTTADQPSGGSMTFKLYVYVEGGSDLDTGTFITIGAGAPAGVFTSSGVHADLPDGTPFYWRVDNADGSDPSASISTCTMLVQPL